MLDKEKRKKSKKFCRENEVHSTLEQAENLVLNTSEVSKV